MHDPVPADEPRGPVHRLVPRRARLGRRRHPQPGRLVALQLRDPRRGRALQGSRRRGAPLQDRGAGGVEAGVGDRRPGDEARLRRRAGGLPDGDRVPGVAANSEPDRAARRAARRAAARHERRQRPLPDGALELERRRPRRSGRRRDPLHRLPLRAEGERARGRPLRADGARGDRRPRDAARRPDRRDRGARPHRREPRGAARRRRRDDLAHRDRRAAASDQGAGRAREHARGGRDLRPGLRRARRGAVHRPHRDRARLARPRALPRARLLRALVRHDRRGGRERRQPARRRARRADSGEHARHDRRRLPRRRLRLRLHAHVRDRRPPRRARARLRGLPRGASSPGSRRMAPV